MRISMETKFNKNTMMRKAIAAGSKASNTRNMQKLIQMVRSESVQRSQSTHWYRDEKRSLSLGGKRM